MVVKQNQRSRPYRAACRRFKMSPATSQGHLRNRTAAGSFAHPMRATSRVLGRRAGHPRSRLCAWLESKTFHSRPDRTPGPDDPDPFGKELVQAPGHAARPSGQGSPDRIHAADRNLKHSSICHRPACPFPRFQRNGWEADEVQVDTISNNAPGH